MSVNDLKKMAEEAAAEGYTPRALKCWPWSHHWTMWSAKGHPLYMAQEVHRRHCVRCGKIKIKTKNLNHF